MTELKIVHERPKIGGNYILGKDHKPILCEDLIEFSQWFERSANQRIIGRTPLAPGIYVSTVFLALDHGVCDDKPVLWESMIVGDKEFDDDVGYERYYTYEEAIEGHMKLVDEIRERLRDRSRISQST